MEGKPRLQNSSARQSKDSMHRIEKTGFAGRRRGEQQLLGSEIADTTRLTLRTSRSTEGKRCAGKCDSKAGTSRIAADARRFLQPPDLARSARGLRVHRRKLMPRCWAASDR